MNYNGQYHNSDGLCEGIASLLFIVDALYDTREGDLIVIDEPKLSLHPAYQRRLADLLAEYAKDRQIVYVTSGKDGKGGRKRVVVCPNANAEANYITKPARSMSGPVL